MIHFLTSLLFSLLFSTVYAYSTDGHTTANHKEMFVITGIVYYLQSTLRNPELWKMNHKLRIFNTQMWGINGGEDI